MSSTPFKIHGKQTDFTFFSGVYHLDIPRDQPEQVLNSEKVIEGYKESNNSLSLISDKKKIFVSPAGAFFHMFSDTVAPLIQQYSMDSEVEIIVDVSVISRKVFLTNQVEFNDNSFTGFFIKALKDIGASVTLINKYDYDVININNFYINDYQFYVGDTYSDMFNLFEQHIDNPNNKPNKKIYLSRKRIPSRIKIFKDRNNLDVVSNDNRLDEEQLLEDYFTSLGYEIVCPEDFESFQQQLNYMHSVKSLVSVSGSGLTNCLFMQPNQTVVELVTPLCIQFEDENNPYKSVLIEDLHHFYSTMAFKKRHKYVALNNQDKSASSIINQIENDPSLKQFLGSI
jgi:hypothetical protein